MPEQVLEWDWFSLARLRRIEQHSLSQCYCLLEFDENIIQNDFMTNDIDQNLIKLSPKHRKTGGFMTYFHWSLRQLSVFLRLVIVLCKKSTKQLKPISPYSTRTKIDGWLLTQHVHLMYEMWLSTSKTVHYQQIALSICATDCSLLIHCRNQFAFTLTKRPWI